MNRFLTWVGLSVAAFASFVAILERGNLPAEVPAAICAVAAAALVIVDVVRPTQVQMPGPYAEQTEWLGRVRGAFRSTRMGREDLVRILDQIERSSSNPALPLRSPEYFEQIARVSNAEFNRYLSERVEALERTT